MATVRRSGSPPENPVEVKTKSVSLHGVLSLPKGTDAVVVFAHGSGSSRLSPRNVYVARVLQESGLGTLLFDLLTKAEDEAYGNRFDIDLLAERLAGATDWLQNQADTMGMKVGYFGASTGAAAALQASVGRQSIGAIVSRGGRPDLAWDYLEKVRAPTLLIVGGRDSEVLELNRKALERMSSEKKLTVVPGATHLFEESGTLEEVARLATDWFNKFLK
jgi:dienelactone hydrolase